MGYNLAVRQKVRRTINVAGQFGVILVGINAALRVMQMA